MPPEAGTEITSAESSSKSACPSELTSDRARDDCLRHSHGTDES